MSRAMAAILNLRSLEAPIVQAGMGSVARARSCDGAMLKPRRQPM
jgi:NAD(P)H-dependent flavin oxidoreductase YrpB (nitropropane dioxygenase family)